LRFEVGTQEKHADDLADLADRVEVLPDRVLLYTEDADRAFEAVHERGIIPESTVSRRATLEDVFLHLTGRSLVE
jgi:lipooligosaccharide transport system ATP-binding protein